jgi:hypothetical protein
MFLTGQPNGAAMYVTKTHNQVTGKSRMWPARFERPAACGAGVLDHAKLGAATGVS